MRYFNKFLIKKKEIQRQTKINRADSRVNVTTNTKKCSNLGFYKTLNALLPKISFPSKKDVLVKPSVNIIAKKRCKLTIFF